MDTVQRHQSSTGNLPFKFIDLFAGIGGFRIALESLGGQCVFTSEWDKHSQATYRDWFGDQPHGDIRAVDPVDIPDHDILAAGFPCQPFSIAGVSKKKSLGRAHGFQDETQGTLFFHLAKVISVKRPPILLLENVKNLKSHDGGRTWAVIKSTLEKLSYEIHDRIIDAAGWVPQHRERIFIVGFDTECFPEGSGFSWDFLGKLDLPRPAFRTILEEKPDPKYTLTDHLWDYLRKYAAKHKAAGNGFGFGLVDMDGVSRTLSARYHKDGSEILIPQGRKNPRRLTRVEAGRLMGFGRVPPACVSDTQMYRQFGNAVVPPVVKAVGKGILDVMRTRILHSNGCLLKRPSGSGHFSRVSA